jgi:MinD superfamily P-loop ATPase
VDLAEAWAAEAAKAGAWAAEAAEEGVADAAENEIDKGPRRLGFKLMKLVVASGKGGTGKTTVAAALALSASGSDTIEGPVTFVDCDVEEPNGHIFLKPSFTHDPDPVTAVVPRVREERCNYCGACRDICRFNAITVLGNTILAFPDMCHSCKGCFLVCEQKALDEDKRLLGHIKRGVAGSVDNDSRGDILFYSGELRVGEAMSSPLIKALKKRVKDTPGLVIYDAPPGTSCPVIKTMAGADFVLLVTEPTPFGLHDLKLCAEVVEILDIPFGVVINRAGVGFDEVEKWCREKGVPILMEIPFDRKIASAYAQGRAVIEAMPGLEGSFISMIHEIEQLIARSGQKALEAGS